MIKNGMVISISKIIINLFIIFIIIIIHMSMATPIIPVFSIISITPIVACASANPLHNVPLDSWVYVNLQKLEAMNLFIGEDSIALNTKPLTHRSVAALINRALLNIQQGKVVLPEIQVTLLEELLTEFTEELKEYGVRVIPREWSSQQILEQYQSEQLYQYLSYFIEKGYIEPLSGTDLPVSRQQIAQLISQMIFSLQSGQLKEVNLSETDVACLDYLVTELKDELSFYGLSVVYLNKSKALINHLEETFLFSGYLNQSLSLIGQNEKIENKQKIENQEEHKKNIKLSQGLFELQFGAQLSGELWEELPFMIDFSLTTQVYDIYNVDFAPLSLNLNKAYLKFQTNSFRLSLPDSIANIPLISIVDEFEIPEIQWQIGREEIFWGPAHSGSLILSDRAAPLNMISYSGNFNLEQIADGLGQLHFTKLFSYLDENRLLFGQRFEYSPDTPWRVALSETAIAAQDCGIGYFNPLPFPLANYLIQQIYSNFPSLSEKENNINYNIGLDGQYLFDNGVKIYGEVMFDDFIFYQKDNPFPGRYGFTLGNYIPNIFQDYQTDLVLEYTRINNYVYYPRTEWQYYLYQGEYLGHPLGPDADQFILEINHQLNEDTLLQFAYIHQRHGEGQKGIPLPVDPVVANENRFLSGIIEKSDNFQASLTYDLSEDWQVSVSGSFQNIYNEDNQLNQNNQNLTLTVELNLEF
jgi:hypothetical protein